ncbi:MAG: hypothetical protein RBU25_03815, partial [Lentisphaeria bacterium]|nr:hypothetical protein [Lentisphaeria bacterium]
MRCLRVLLLASSAFDGQAASAAGTRALRTDSNAELHEYLRLLLAANIPFDVLGHHELRIDHILKGSAIAYASIILTIPYRRLSSQTIDIIRTVSHDHGVSVLAAADRVGGALKEVFGIADIAGKRFCLPCRVSKTEFLRDLPGIPADFALGPGLRIPIQRHGLRKHPRRYVTAHLDKLTAQPFFYLKTRAAPGTRVLATIQGTADPAIYAYTFGKARNYFIAVQASRFLAQPSPLHRIVTACLKGNSGWGMAAINLEHTMVLRMDDPGTCERVYLRGYDTRLLDAEDWRGMVEVLESFDARLSVMYVPLWVDDGSAANGRLFVEGRDITPRRPGAQYPSKDVRFVRRLPDGSDRTYDYAAEFSALQETQASGRVDIESHGLNHLDPHLDHWLAAEDRYANYEWFHEFRHVVQDRDVAEADQVRILRRGAELIRAYFGAAPCAVTPSGHHQSRTTERLAHSLGYRLFSSDWQSIDKHGTVLRNDKIPALFFESTAPTPEALSAGFPVVGVFHDYDIARHGVSWLAESLAAWKAAG